MQHKSPLAYSLSLNPQPILAAFLQPVVLLLDKELLASLRWGAALFIILVRRLWLGADWLDPLGGLATQRFALKCSCVPQPAKRAARGMSTARVSNPWCLEQHLPSMPTSVGGPVPHQSRQGRQKQRYGLEGERLVAGCVCKHATACIGVLITQQLGAE